MPTINSPTPDATTLTKGKIQLAGVLAGTAALPAFSTTAGGLGGASISWSPTIVGFSANPSGIYQYTKVGKFVTLFINQYTNGTSNSATFTISLPVTALTLTNAQWVVPAQVVNNGASGFGQAFIASAGTVLNITADAGGSGFATSGNKRTIGMQITYEVA